jgi:hypothetical protein
MHQKIWSQSNNMSHESIDTNRPYLVPRNSGDIEVWHVETNEDGTPKVDEQGWVMLSSQHEEQDKDGKMVVPSKLAHPDALTDEVQGHYADILGQSRHTATPEQFERYNSVNNELADTALEAIDLDDEQEQTDERNPLIAEFFEEAPLNAITDLTQQVRTRTDMLGQELDHLEATLSQVQYAGGNAQSAEHELRNSYESMQRLVLGGGPEADLSVKVLRFNSSAEELADAIRRSETSSEKDLFEVRKVEDAMAEMHAANHTILRGYDEIRHTLTPHGQFESYLEELLRTPQGYEYTIALLKSKISEMFDDAMRIRAKSVMMEQAVEDLQRIKNI